MTYTINNYKITPKDFDYMINLLKHTQNFYKEMEDMENYYEYKYAVDTLLYEKTIYNPVTQLVSVINKRRQFKNIMKFKELIKYEFERKSEYHFNDYVRNIISHTQERVLDKPVKEIKEEYKIILKWCNALKITPYELQ
jgi:hypothetical protein